jgi:hypothetical protein
LRGAGALAVAVALFFAFSGRRVAALNFWFFVVVEAVSLTVAGVALGAVFVFCITAFGAFFGGDGFAFARRIAGGLTVADVFGGLAAGLAGAGGPFDLAKRSVADLAIVRGVNLFIGVANSVDVTFCTLAIAIALIAIEVAHLTFFARAIVLAGFFLLGTTVFGQVAVIFASARGADALAAFTGVRDGAEFTVVARDSVGGRPARFRQRGLTQFAATAA